MKKFTALLLSVCLLLASLSSVLVSTATPAADDTYFETASNWKRYYQSTGDAIGGASSSNIGKISVNTTETAGIYEEGASSLKIDANGTAAAIKLPNLVVGKSYVLSFRYYVPSTTIASSTNAWMSGIGIYQNGTATVGSGAAITCTTPVATGHNAVGAGSLYVNGSGIGGDETWYTYTLSFSVSETSGTDLYFAFRNWFKSNDNDVLYLDDFLLDELDYYNNAENWLCYKSSQTIGGDTTNPNATIAQNSKKTADFRTPSVAFSGSNVGQGGIPAIKLQNVTAGKTYLASFSYYTDGYYASSYTDFAIYNIGIYKAGTAVTSNNSAIDTADAIFVNETQKGKTKETWYTYTFAFSLDETDVQDDLYFACRLWKATTVYLNLKVEELDVNPHEQDANWSVYKSGQTIGGASTSGYISMNLDNKVEGKTSLYIGGQRGYVSAVKLQNLSPNSEYTFRFQYYVPSGVTISSANIWFHQPGIYPAGATVQDMGTFSTDNAVATKNLSGQTANDTWYPYEISFTTAENTELYFACKMWNASTTMKIYFDDFELVKHEKSTITFVTNSEESIDPVTGAVGAPFTMPATPTKDGASFAGWYTDKECTNQFLCKTLPDTDTTLYARWISGIYADFEDFTSTSNNPSNATIITDYDASYAGGKVLKMTSAASTATAAVVPITRVSKKLFDYAKPGDKLSVSLKYRVVSGSASFYLHSSKSSQNATNFHGFNAIDYQSSTLNTTTGWSTIQKTYTIKSAETLSAKEITVNTTVYPSFYFTLNPNTEIYIDDIVIERRINVPVSYQNETVRLVPANPDKPLTSAVVGDTLGFKAEYDDSITPSIVYDDATITPDANGIYTIVVKDLAKISVTSTGQTAAQNHAPGVGLNGEDLTTYNQEVYSAPIWEGDTVYHEAVMFAKGKLQNEGENGEDAIVDQTTKTLLYPVEDVISIRSANLKTWYVKGVDFDIVDGKLVWLEGGKIPLYDGYFTVDQSTSDATTDDALYTEGRVASTYTTSETNGLVIMNDGDHEKYTVYVTYRHSTEWAEGEGYQPIAPEAQGNDLSKLYAKLASGEDIDVMVFGASTATGCSSTGANMNYNLLNSLDKVQERSSGGGIKAPTFFEQATNTLVAKYGVSNQINYHNIALGGKTAAWALKDTDSNVTTENGKSRLVDRVEALENYYREQGALGEEERISPDLIYIKFCGNDVRVDDVTYKTQIKQIISIFRENLGYTNAAIILMSGKVNNQRTYLYNLTDTFIPPRKGDENFKNYQREQEAALVELANETENCIAVQNTTFWQNIVASKDGEDYLSNNINHANDFWAMATAQQIVATAAQTWLDTSYDSKAAIRAEGQGDGGITKNGLRTYNRVLVPDNVNIVEFGSTAVRASYLERLLKHEATNSFTLSLAKKYQGKGVGIGVSHRAEDVATITGNTPVATKMWDRDEDGAVIFTAYLTGIEPKNYADDYRIQAYAIDEGGNVYFGEASYISIFKVANAIDAAYTADQPVPDIDKSAFWYFVNETTFADYKAWCEDYDCVCGKLYDAAI